RESRTPSSKAASDCSRPRLPASSFSTTARNRSSTWSKPPSPGPAFFDVSGIALEITSRAPARQRIRFFVDGLDFDRGSGLDFSVRERAHAHTQAEVDRLKGRWSKYLRRHQLK